MQQFDKVASVYAQSRPTYPKEVYDRILEWCNVQLIGTVVDIGCGAGHSIDGLIPISKDIIGIEPGENLRREAIKKYPMYKILPGTGEETGLPSDIANLVTVATAFYWMDRERALAEISRILKQNGSLVLYRYLFPGIEGPANEILISHCNEYWNQFREERLVKDDDSDIIINQTGLFSDAEKDTVRNIWSLSVSNFVAFLSSTSYVSKYLETLTPESKEQYLLNLTDAFTPYSEGGVINVNFDIHMIFTKKKHG